MHIHFLDPYHQNNSLIHVIDARVKFVLTLAFILTTALTPVGAWPIYIMLFALIMAVVILSELGVGFVLKRALLALPFVLAALPVIFTQGADPWFTFSIGTWGLTVYGSGVARFLSIALKSWISVQAAIVLASSTPFPELLAAMRAVKVPRLLVGIFGLMWRYLFVLADEAMRLIRARASRSGHSDRPDLRPGGKVTWRARVAGGMAGNLFIRAFERSDRIYVAMLSRGYDGEVRATPLPPLSKVSWLILIFSLALLGLLLTLAVIL
jgi:cobalt/nickel transport system permease protein